MTRYEKKRLGRATADELAGLAAKKAREATEPDEANEATETPAPAPEKLGIEQTEKLLGLFAALMKLLADVLKGRKITAMNAMFAVLKSFIKNREVFQNLGVVWDELRDLSVSEYDQLCTMLANKLGMDSIEDPIKTRRAVRGILDIVAFSVSLKA